MPNRPNVPHHIPLVRHLNAAAVPLGIDPNRNILGMIPFRVSGGELRKLGNQIAGNHAVSGVQKWLEHHGPKIIADDAPGLVRVVEGDLLPNFNSNKRVGYVGFVEDLHKPGYWWVVITVANSGAMLQLPSEEVANGLSAWAQLVTWAWDWAKSAQDLRFVRDDRMARDLEVFAPINGAVKRRVGGVYWWGADRIDPHKDDWRAVIGAQKAADGANNAKGLTTRGRAKAWEASEWTESEKYLPFGLWLPTQIDAQGVTSKSKRPAVDPVAAPLVQGMWERAAQGWDMAAIAVDVAANGARNARGALLALKVAPLMTAEQLTGTQAVAASLPAQEQDLLLAALGLAGQPMPPRQAVAARQAATQAAKRVFQYLRFYRTGRLTKVCINPVPGLTIVNGIAMTFLVEDARDRPRDVDPGQVHTIADFERDHPDHPVFKIRTDNRERFDELRFVGFYHHELTLPRPVELTDEQWQSAEAAIPSKWLTRRRTGVAKRQSKPTAPLSQLAWHDGDQQYRIWQDHGRYLLLSGALHTKTETMTNVASISCRALHRALGGALVAMAEQLDGAIAPLPVLMTAPTVETVDPVAVAESRIANIESKITAEKAIVKGLFREKAPLDPVADELRHDSLEESIKDAEATIAGFRVELTDAFAELARREAAIREDVGEDTDAGFTIDVDANPLVVIGARLQQLADDDIHLDSPQMSAAVAWVLDKGALLRSWLGEGRNVHLDVCLRLPGRTTPQVIEGPSLTLTRTDGGIRGRRWNPTLPRLGEEAARWALYDLNGEAFRTQHEWTVGFLVEELRDWLHAHGLETGAANAIIDTALIADPRIPVSPIVYAWATATGTDEQRLDAARSVAAAHGIEQMAEPIIDAYVHQGSKWPSRGTGWVRRPLSDLRRLTALVSSQGRKVARADVAAALALNHVDVDGTAVDDRTALRNLARLDAPLLPVAMDNFSMWTEHCERLTSGGSCSGRMATVVAVPETMLNGALLACNRCHRPAGDYWTHRPLPAGWREPWDAPAARVDLMRGRCSILATPPAAAHCTLPRPMLSVSTAAKKLHIGRLSTARLIVDGVIRATAVTDNRGGWLIPAEEVERDAVTQAATAMRERRYQPPGAGVA